MARKNTSTRQLEVSRLDDYFQALKAESGLVSQTPPRGWIHALRNGLGMSATQLAKRLGVSRAAVYKLEEREVSRSIALKQLERVADAMDCDVVYAMMPRSTLRQSISDRARNNAETRLRAANVSMGLEAEGVNAKEFAAAVSSSSSYTEALADRTLWDD